MSREKNFNTAYPYDTDDEFDLDDRDYDRHARNQQKEKLQKIRKKSSGIRLGK